MCLIPKPDTPDAPQLPVERAAMKQPTSAVLDSTKKRASDQARAASSTVLTSGSGVTTAAPTAKKTLLGA
jgi:hypothetical protein